MKAFNLHERLKSSGPKVKSADIHLIIEYDKNESLGEKLKSTRANRFIVHADQYNPVLAAHDTFKTLFDEAESPDILVVGGLQMMEGMQNTTFWPFSHHYNFKGIHTKNRNEKFISKKYHR